MKKYICLMLCVFMTIVYIPCVYGADGEISITMTTGTTGNIFFGGENGEFVFRFINSSYEDYEITAIFSAVGSKGNTVWSKTEQFTLKGLNYSVKNIRLDFDANIKFFDVYKLKVELSDESKGLSKTSMFDFSYVRNNEGIEKNDDFGINTHYTSYDKNPQVIAQTMPLLEKTGASVIRDSISWSSFEKAKGEYAEISEFPYVFEARKHGIDLLMILAYGNQIYTPQNMSVPVTETEVEAFSAYAENLASKLKGITNYFELWNEPNANGFNADNSDEADYANLAKSVYPALKRVNENSVLMGMATTSSDTGWMQNVHDVGGTAYMDNISFHPYRWYGYPGNYDFIPRLQRVQDFMTNNNLDKKMWLTELGWSSGIYEGQTEVYADEYEKAMYLVHSYVMSRQFENVEKYFWYNFICKGTNEGNFNDNFGMIANANDSIPFRARQAYLSAVNMNIILANAEFEEFEEVHGGTYIYKFNRKTDGAKVYVLWTVNGTDTVSLNITENKVIEYDLFGNKTEHRIFDGKYETDVSLEPLYIEILSDELTDIRYKEEVVEIDGVAPMRKVGCDVSMVVLRPGKTLKEVYSYGKEALAYIDDTKTNVNGEYSFKFIIPDTGEDYYAYVLFEDLESYMVIPLNPGREIESEITIEVNGENIDSLHEFLPGKNVKISYKLDNRSLESVNAKVIIAFFKDNMLTYVSSKDVSVRGDNILFGDTETTVPNLEFDRVGVYIWNKNTLEPYMNNISF